MYREMKGLKIQIMSKKLGHGERVCARQRQEVVQTFKDEGINDLMLRGWRMCARFEGQQELVDMTTDFGSEKFYNQLQNESLEQLLVTPSITAG